LYSFVYGKGNIKDVPEMEGWKAGQMYLINRQNQSAKDNSKYGMHSNLKNMRFPYEGWMPLFMKGYPLYR
jgi:hypothetical protein